MIDDIFHYEHYSFVSLKNKMPLTKDNKNGKILQIPDLGHTVDSRGLGYLLFASMEKHKDKIAQINTLTGEEDTFGAFRQRCTRTAITMKSKGLISNDIISVFTTNHLNSYVPIIGSLFIGIKPAPLDPTMSLKDIVYLLEQIKPKIIFVNPEGVDLIERSVQELNKDVEIVIFGETNKYTPFSAFLQPKEGEDNFEPVSPKDIKQTAMIFFSSGTSGLPKGICVSHYGFIKQLYNTINFGFTLDRTHINASVYWLIGANFYGACILTGKTRLFLPQFDPKLMWEKIHNYKPTVIFLPPYHIHEMLNVGKPRTVDTSSIKDINLGGGSVSKEQMLTIKKTFVGSRITLSYGMTEALGFLSCFNLNNSQELDFAEKRLTSSGRGVSGFSYKVVNAETEELLGPNQNGELRLKSDNLFNYYYNASPQDVYDSDGWFRTGDIAYYDDDGCLYIVDRIKEILRVKSWDVPPVLIENILLAHPSVKAAVVIGISHNVDGEHPMGVVVLKENSKYVTEEEIEKYVEERVDDRQRLRAGVKFVDRISTTPSGKVKRNELKKQYCGS